MAQHKGAIPVNKTKWPDESIEWLKKNYNNYTNPELAKMLGKTLTVLRNKLRELGLKRIEMEYWTPEMVEYLTSVYTTAGDVEIALIFQKKYPKKKQWRKQHICKKRKYLGLKRTPEQVKQIMKINCSVGGRCYTIDKNSSSKNMHDNWVLQRLAWRNKPLQQHIKNSYPELIDLKRKQLILNQNTKQNEYTSKA